MNSVPVRGSSWFSRALPGLKMFKHLSLQISLWFYWSTFLNPLSLRNVTMVTLFQLASEPSATESFLPSRIPVPQGKPAHELCCPSRITRSVGMGGICVSSYWQPCQVCQGLGTIFVFHLKVVVPAALWKMSVTFGSIKCKIILNKKSIIVILHEIAGCNSATCKLPFVPLLTAVLKPPDLTSSL